MGIFNLFSTGIVLTAVEKINKGIKETHSFKYFTAEDTEMIREYKDFECTMIASAIATISLKLDMGSSKVKKEIQTVYIGKSAPFIRKLLSGQYRLPELKADEKRAEMFFKKNIEAMICFNIHVKFEEYLSEIRKAIEEQSPFYFWKYDEPYIDDITEEESLGENRLCDFVWKVLLAEERHDYEDYEGDSNYIGYKVYMELNENETELLFEFIKALKLIMNK